jgi:AcrR family transcriptional regulator
MGRRTPKPDNHSRIKTAAGEVFATRSYRDTAVDDIVEEAGTSRGSFYYYFTSKADVARDLQEELWGDAAHRADQAVDPEADFLTNVRRGLEAYLAALKDLGAERAFLSEGFVEPTLAMFDGEGEKWGGHFIRQRLVDAMDKGEIPHQDPDPPARLLVEALQTLTLAALNGEDVTDPLRVIEDLNQALASGVEVG